MLFGLAYRFLQYYIVFLDFCLQISNDKDIVMTCHDLYDCIGYDMLCVLFPVHSDHSGTYVAS